MSGDNDTKKLEILIVDDVKENLFALNALLSRDDFNIFEAQSGKEALELMMNHDFCLALIDVQMPEMNGFELAELMRGSNKTKDIPIIFVTAGDKDQKYVFKGYESGAVDFLTKPLDSHTVKSKVNVFLDLHQQKNILKKQVEMLKEIREQQDKSLAELNKTKEELKKAIRAREEFMAISSHEIRTPMNAIIGMSNLLAETKLDEKQTKYVEIFQKAGLNLLHIIDDILDISKIESGKFKIEIAEFNLKDLIMEVVDIVLNKAEAKKLILTYFVAPNIPERLLGDDFRIKQILINLIGNSIKFTTHGSIVLRVGVNNDKMRKGNLWFEVTDTGIGISKEQQDNLFQLYSQAGSRIAKSYGGSGLGLTISKRLVEMMGGEIWMDSKEGVGTKMYFTLECPENISVTAIPEVKIKDKKMAHLTKAKILLVDDAEFNRILVKEYLKDTKHIITEAENGKIAVEKATHEEFDIILMDIQMPVMDGYAATREIRKWEQETNHAHTPIIAVTAYAMKEEQEKSLEVGCDQHLSKPIMKENLMQALDIVGQI